MKTGIATFGLDYGKCPPWLFERMVKLGRSITEAIVEEYGPEVFVERISEPGWFQSLGTVLAFDWNASGLTTILTAALKEAIRGQESELGIFIAGGKGKTSLKTPDEVVSWGERVHLPYETVTNLAYTSKMAAKVDSSLLQDGFQLYHHALFFTKSGAWTIVQQGMNKEKRAARRYHWHSQFTENFVQDPHRAISTNSLSDTLNLATKRSEKTQKISTELVRGNFDSLMKDIQLLRRHQSDLSYSLAVQQGQQVMSFLHLENTEFTSHPVEFEDFSKSKYLEKILYQVTDQKPQTYEEMLSLPGVGPKTIRALSLVSEVIYGAKPSYEDPARYSFAHGGKDATPYPVDIKTYDQTISVLEKAVKKAKIDSIEKEKALKKLHKKPTEPLL